MKIILVICILATCVISIQCRPQAVQIEKQVLRFIPQETSFEPRRGSLEETHRILQEIEKINIAMGYKKKQDVAFPRTQGFNEGYFYPRPVYQPLNFRTTTSPAPLFKQFNGQELVSTVDPFQAQVYYYPAPYLRVPMPDGARAFRPHLKMKKTKELQPKIYVLPIAVHSADGQTNEIRYLPSTVDFGTLRAFGGKGKAMQNGEVPLTRGLKKSKGVMDEVAVSVEEEKIEEDLLEEMLDVVEYELGVDEEAKDKKKKAPLVPALPNDKFLNSKFADSGSDEKDDGDSDFDMLILNKSAGPAGRSFNISATFQNFTNRFSILPSSTPTTTLTSEEADLKELTNTTTVEAEVEEEKSPFGFFNRQSEPANGGLVIQRLRVRHGGIAIAGPGGVATAGSGGTAIVGPNGTAITHPRSLTIAGPGAKIYAVPETVDLGKTINATRRSLPVDAVLVANGPVPQPFPSPYLLAPGTNVNLNYPPPAPLVPFGGRSGFFDDATFHLIPSASFAPHPFGRIPKTLPVDPKRMRLGGATDPIKLTDIRNQPVAENGQLRQPKRIVNAPYVQALQQPNNKFKIQKLKLAQSPIKAAPAKITKVTTTKNAENNPTKTQQEAAPEKLQALIQDFPVFATATGSTAADQPVPRVPIAPAVAEFYPFYGVPVTENRDEASLILEPSSKAVSGNGGTAISTPVSHAILKHGSSTRILFRPQSVAIVGANGRAHAQADLIVDYVKASVEHRTASDVLKLPFYGGARGQILEIRKNSDGTVVSKILRGDDEEMKLKVHQIVDELKQNEDILAEDDDIRAADQSFGDYLLNIQKAAASLVTLQEQVKKTGKLSNDQKKVYADNLEKLGVAAQKLAHIQQQDDDHDAIKFLFDSQFDQSDAQKKKASPTTHKVTTFPGYKGKDEESHHKKKEEEENVGEDDSSSNSQNDSDSVQVNSPEKEASIAEAKPVGLAIAGEGGVASSKPVATAVVGDGGLAVARPVATAIAGIKPSEIGSLGLPIAINKKLVTKGKYGLVAADQDVPTGLLVGPGFQEARVSQNEIEAEIDDARQQAYGQVDALAPSFDTEKFLASLRLKAKQQQQQQQNQPPQQQQTTFNPQSLYYQPQSNIPQSYPFLSDYLSSSQYPVYTPSFLPYYSWNPYTAAAAYQNQLALLAAYQQQQQLAFQSQYNPYFFNGGHVVPQHSFQQYEYPQRAAFYSAPNAINQAPLSATAAAYQGYYNYPSYSAPSPYRFFYY
ncbi:uncharacterized protein LOC128736400 [Sabethes cyaneus]|uniref:uncharacterized protein LOC128736400 n=1 Tax=Sabethes cyaneus TaxID=53552 RepID=UPI00237DD960|nr:uncharacterized protein LOC128736400 [Sabethes cyaneus]